MLAERGTLGDHPSVAITFSLAFKKVADRNPAAADLIRICAFLAPDAIPEELFTAGAEELGEPLVTAARNVLDFANLLREAGRFSLLDRDAGGALPQSGGIRGKQNRCINVRWQSGRRRWGLIIPIRRLFKRI